MTVSHPACLCAAWSEHAGPPKKKNYFELGKYLATPNGFQKSSPPHSLPHHHTGASAFNPVSPHTVQCKNVNFISLKSLFTVQCKKMVWPSMDSFPLHNNYPLCTQAIVDTLWLNVIDISDRFPNTGSCSQSLHASPNLC